MTRKPLQIEKTDKIVLLISFCTNIFKAELIFIPVSTIKIAGKRRNLTKYIRFENGLIGIRKVVNFLSQNNWQIVDFEM